MNAQLAHIVEEIKELNDRDKQELVLIITQLTERKKKRETIRSFDLGGQFDNVNIRKLAYEE